MKRRGSYVLSPFRFADDTRQEIQRRLKSDTDNFLELIAEPCGHYVEEVKLDVQRPTVNEWREALKRIGQEAEGVAAALRALDIDCARLLDQGYALTTGRSKCRETVLPQFDELILACKRSASFRQMNPGEGLPIDFNRRRLTLACAEAYNRVTGKEPKTSPNGTFAHVLLAVEHAVHATPQSHKNVSADYLKSVLTPTRKGTRGFAS